MEERNIQMYTKKYLKAPFLEENVEYRRKCVLAQLEKYPHRKILEIGCGMFPLFHYMKTEYDKYYIVDPSIFFANNARELAGEQLEKKIWVYTGYFEQMLDVVRNVEPDFIICSSLLHEVRDERGLLQAIREVAVKESVIHINVPNATSMHRLIAKEMGLIEDIYTKSKTQNELQQRQVYDMEQLKTLVIENGYDILEEGSYFIKPFTHRQMSLMLKQNIIDKKVLEGLDRIVKYFPENGSEIFVNLKKNIEI